MSSPATAGVCALVLDANPFLSASQVKEIILTTTREDVHTGDLPATGDNYWGMGKVNAYAAVQLALNTIGLGLSNPDEIVTWTIYPNPTSDQLQINGLESITDVRVIDLSGKTAQTDYSDGVLNVRSLSPGTYIVRVVSNGKVYQQACIIQ